MGLGKGERENFGFFFHLGNCMKIGGPSTNTVEKKKLKLCIYFAAHDIDFSNSWEAWGGGGPKSDKKISRINKGYAAKLMPPL